MDRVYETFKKHIEFAKEKYGKRLMFVGLYGSQNYGVDTEDSDVDTKCIVLPTVDELCRGVKTNVTHNYVVDGDDGHMEVKDVYSYMGVLGNLSMNFMEPFEGKYRFSPLAHTKFCVEVYHMFPDLVRENPVRAVWGVVGRAVSHLERREPFRALVCVRQGERMLEYITDQRDPHMPYAKVLNIGAEAIERERRRAEENDFRDVDSYCRAVITELSQRANALKPAGGPLTKSADLLKDRAVEAIKEYMKGEICR